MKCVFCGVKLAARGISRMYCPTCGRVYKRSERVTDGTKIFVPTEETYTPELVLQTPGGEVALNRCFKNTLTALTRLDRSQRQSSMTSTPLVGCPGFASGEAPLVHFVWFGTPATQRSLEAVFTWAPLLSNGWRGVCLWLDDDCFAKFRDAWGAEPCDEVTTLMTDTIAPLGVVICSGVPIYFASIDQHMQRLTLCHEDDAQNLTILKAAIDWERQNQAPFQLVQVASDILRVLLLRFYGGGYFDFDVLPSLRCRSTGFLPPGEITLGDIAFLSHRKQFMNENDIIFADPRQSCLKLNDLVKSMVAFYKTPNARAILLKKLLLQHFQEGEITELIEKYLEGRDPDRKLLLKLAMVIDSCLIRGVKQDYAKLLDDDVGKLVGLLSDTIQKATFEGFQLYDEQDEKRWNCIAPCFSLETLNKLFYSWKDPGANKALEIIESTITLQAAVRGYLVRKQMSEGNVPVLPPSDAQPYLYRFRGRTTAYDHDANYYFVAGTFYITTTVDNERYIGIHIVSAQGRKFVEGTTSTVVTVSDQLVFVHGDVLQFPFIEAVG